MRYIQRILDWENKLGSKERERERERECLCVSESVYVYVFVFVCVCLRMYVCVNVYVCVCECVCMCLCVHLCLCLCVWFRWYIPRILDLKNQLVPKLESVGAQVFFWLTEAKFLYVFTLLFWKMLIQAGAALFKAKVKLKVLVGVGIWVEVIIDVGVKILVGGWSDKAKIILFDVVVEVEV